MKIKCFLKKYLIVIICNLIVSVIILCCMDMVRGALQYSHYMNFRKQLEKYAVEHDMMLPDSVEKFVEWNLFKSDYNFGHIENIYSLKSGMSLTNVYPFSCEYITTDNFMFKKCTKHINRFIYGRYTGEYKK